MQVGDEVQIKAKNLKHRRVVKSIYNRTTDTTVKPGFQIPGHSGTDPHSYSIYNIDCFNV